MKTSRRERKIQAEIKRGRIVQELLDYMQAEMKRTGKDWERVCTFADQKIAAMIELKPQEASIIREATRRLTDGLDAVLKERASKAKGGEGDEEERDSGSLAVS